MSFILTLTFWSGAQQLGKHWQAGKSTLSHVHVDLILLHVLEEDVEELGRHTLPVVVVPGVRGVHVEPLEAGEVEERESRVAPVEFLAEDKILVPGEVPWGSAL